MDLLSHEKHQAYGLSSVIAREWKLNQKWSFKFIKNPQWPTGKRSLRLLRQLKCLTALKNLLKVSEFYRYDALNLLSYMTLDVKNIHLVVFLVGIAGLKNPIGNPLFYEPIPTTFPLKLATLLNNPLQKFPFSNKSPPLKIPPLTLTTHAPHLFPEQNLEKWIVEIFSSFSHFKVCPWWCLWNCKFFLSKLYVLYTVFIATGQKCKSYKISPPLWPSICLKLASFSTMSTNSAPFSKKASSEWSPFWWQNTKRWLAD